MKAQQLWNVLYDREATFVCAGNAIATRVGAPFRTTKLGYWFKANGNVNYDEVCLQDGHVRIGFNWKGVRYYMPIRIWIGAAPLNNSVGLLWGSIK
ncbi:SH3 domain-containing protein [Staphylococcus ratti]|uniref:SH3 domain-containing protein n=1 Tax=Staphylococcus ratti TaxID=2892440 RepID=A0ABY3PB44_9STAP|nr:SH3 domain-containing protein [Staphylococcus ratti]UEX89525.1 SH3 domain-containing protein [Staphylococcus ratti]